MRIPRGLKIHICNECQAELNDDDFRRTGVFIQKNALFFDYKCPACGYYGMYVFELKEGMDIFDGLKAIMNLLEQDFSGESQKENVVSQLNMIVGVTDFLKLGGKHAPTEPTRTDT